MRARSAEKKSKMGGLFSDRRGPGINQKLTGGEKKTPKEERMLMGGNLMCAERYFHAIAFQTDNIRGD